MKVKGWEKRTIRKYAPHQRVDRNYFVTGKSDIHYGHFIFRISARDNKRVVESNSDLGKCEHHERKIDRY
jgi:hypothetical protein